MNRRNALFATMGIAAMRPKDLSSARNLCQPRQNLPDIIGDQRIDI